MFLFFTFPVVTISKLVINHDEIGEYSMDDMKAEAEFIKMEKVLVRMTSGNFPFATITEITINTVKPIMAPKYAMCPETTEKEQIESAKRTYGF